MNGGLAVRNGKLPSRLAGFHQIHINCVAAAAGTRQYCPFRGIPHDVQSTTEIVWKLRAALDLDDRRYVVTPAEPKPQAPEIGNQIFHSVRHVVSRKGRTSPRPR